MEIGTQNANVIINSGNGKNKEVLLEMVEELREDVKINEYTGYIQYKLDLIEEFINNNF